MSRGSKRRGAMRIVLVSAAAATFAVSAAGCSDADEYDSVYCVDSDNRVVDDDYCDDDEDGGSSHGYYIWHRSGRHHYSVGSVVSGGSLIHTRNTDARIRAGLPGSGRVTTGIISRGGVGKGSSGTSGG